LTFDGSFSTSDELNDALITDTRTNTSVVKFDNTINNQTQAIYYKRIMCYLLGKSQFEGYRGDFSELLTDYS
jgi:hypothetical protein